ncbi:hypothetical protein ILYODFUR_018842 [Ilyodon furcidens]|uniref:Uncharacterized protein n=1 Tax=Ilyodon furcidens TaxID=33524 RepID=A0ABV0UT71_9TELE
MLRHSAGLSVPQSDYDESTLAIPCTGTGPLSRRSSSPLHLAGKPTSSSCRRKHRHGAPSCGSSSEEADPMAAVVRAASNNPASSSATAPSPRLTAALTMPSSLASAEVSVATPGELEECLRFYARQIKSFRRTSLLYSSPELMEEIRQMEEDYWTAIRQFYCRAPPSSPSLQRAAAAKPTSGLQSSAAAELPTPGLQSSAAAEQPTPGLQRSATEQPTPGLQGAAAKQSTPGLQSSAAAEQPTSGLQSATVVQPKSALTSSTHLRGRR